MEQECCRNRRVWTSKKHTHKRSIHGNQHHWRRKKGNMELPEKSTHTHVHRTFNVYIYPRLSGNLERKKLLYQLVFNVFCRYFRVHSEKTNTHTHTYTYIFRNTCCKIIIANWMLYYILCIKCIPLDPLIQMNKMLLSNKPYIIYQSTI